MRAEILASGHFQRSLRCAGAGSIAANANAAAAVYPVAPGYIAMMLSTFRRAAAVSCIALLALLVTHASQALKAPEQTSASACAGLHAGITARLMQGDGRVMVGFSLLNDSEMTEDTAQESWKVVIDDKELSDSGMIFGNGPAPSGGFGSLPPGEAWQFGKALPIAQYFPERKQYKVSWRGKDFQSPSVMVRIPSLNP